MPSPYFAKPYGKADHCAVENFYKIASDGREKERLLMVMLSLEGYRASEIGNIVHRDTDTVLHWLHRWNEAGFEGLHDRPYSGCPPILTPAEQSETVEWVISETSSGKRLTCGQISVYAEEKFGKKADHETIRRMMHRHGCSWQKPGTKDGRADPELQEKFREELRETIDSDPQIRIFFMDEAIFSLSTTVTHTWGRKGERPVFETNLSHDKIIETGAVEPLTGENFHLFLPFTTKASFEVFVKEFALAFPDDRILLIHDGAPWHNISSPEKRIELKKLPAYSPELNPIERLWRWIRENFTHNKFFETIDELEKALTDCLNDNQRLESAIRSVCTIT